MSSEEGQKIQRLKLEIESAINSLTDGGTKHTSEQARKIIEDIYDIMKITGHTSPAMLRKYIKAENLTVVEKITDKYNYFNWWEKVEKDVTLRTNWNEFMKITGN